MLTLKNIRKEYQVADFKVVALDDINLSFRKNEFVSILGPSGSGKTTLLNLIGGLDKYTQGDLIINGKSTKTFKDKDWDVYRNHRVGFIFQSYNLIPHQTVLNNVALALTIAGISKEERIKRAKEALDRVGLSDQYDKKPNQLSGGQSQRVAIARALVNDPEILLADEPTGALDTKTSKQIMDLIKEIASDRLVIMVTHNPELAEEYSSRIINLRDGKLVDDSNPYVKNEQKSEKPTELKKVSEKAKMSWWTTFKLSLQNLFSKKNRTILTAIASSIGIIGISLVLSLSFGVKKYISNMQDDMLSGNPITVDSSTIDFEAMMSGMTNEDKKEIIKNAGYVNVSQMIEALAKRSQTTNNLFVENNITQAYLDYIFQMPEEDIAAIFLDYELDLKNNFYLENYSSKNSESEKMSLTTLISIYTSILKENEDTAPFASMISSFTNFIKQAPNNSDYILEQYTILDGVIAKDENELMLVLDKDRQVSDLVLAQLGFYSQEEFINLVLKETNSSDYNPHITLPTQFKYEDIIGKTFMWYPNNSIYQFTTSVFDPEKVNVTYLPYEKDLKNKEQGIPLTIVGILEPKETISYGSLRSGLYYTEALTKTIIKENLDSEISNYLMNLEGKKIQSGSTEIEMGGMPVKYDFGITFKYNYYYLDQLRENVTGFVGQQSALSSMMGAMSGMGGFPKLSATYELTLRDVGGEELPSKISFYARDLKHKPSVLKYLNAYNDDENLDPSDYITLSDPLSVIFNMINTMINVITIALIGFTTLALVVSSVMIAIITYVSVVERVKEIGVIRSLGGRKKDVSNLFVAETVIIGLSSGIIAVLFTYFASFIINLFVYKSINSNIAVFPWHYALLMLSISILLTLISGLIPSRSAAKKDPVVALRSE